MYNIYALRDVLVGFGPIIVEQSDAVAIRNFSSLVDSPNVPMSDFELYQLGTYDAKSGLINPCVVPLLVARGVDFVRKGVDSDAVE